MPYDSSGVATVERQIAVTGQVVQAVQVNTPFADIESMLSQLILRSGVAPFSGNQSLAGFKFTNSGQASADGDLVPKSQLDTAVAALQAQINTSNQTLSTKGGDYTALDADYNVILRFTASATLSITPTADLRAAWTCEIWAEGGDVIIDPNSTDTVNGNATLTLKRGQKATLFKTSATTFILGIFSDSFAGVPIAGQIYALSLSANVSDAANDIDISAGNAASDDAFPYIMQLSSTLTKRIDANWSVGTGGGGLDTGVAGNAIYYIWLIQRPDTGLVDALISQSSTSPTMPPSYTRKRLIGSILRNSNANVSFSWETQEKRIGVGQSWQAVSRAINTSYTNSTGRPILVSIYSESTDTGGFQISTDNSNWFAIGFSTFDATSGASARRLPASGPYLVPAHHFYRFTGSSFNNWNELR